MTDLLRRRTIGMGLARLDGPAKVTGTAPYAFEHPVENPVYLQPIQAAVARGRVRSVDTTAAAALGGVLRILTHADAPRLDSLDDRELAILQDGDVAFRGQFIGAVIARTPEVAREAASLVRVAYDERPHDVELHADRDDLYAPQAVNPASPTDTGQGDVEAAMADAAVRIDRTYTTAMYHNNPMEPHTTVALWDGRDLTLYESTQGAHPVRDTVATVVGLDPARVHVIAPHVGGGFGSKGRLHAPTILAILAALALPRTAVKLALTRHQMFALTGYRTPTIQRVRLGAHPDGRLRAIAHDVVEQTSRIKEFAEQTAVPTRSMYAAPHRRTSHRLAALDVPVPSWMRAPGECPGMFGPEVAMDELAYACDLDPVELRIRNDTDLDPDTGLPFSSRNLVACLRDGARRFGWDERAPEPARRQEQRWWVGLGVASSIYPTFRMSGSVAEVEYGRDERWHVRIGAADIGTGTWTTLTQIAADALDVPLDAIRLHIGDTALPRATVAGGSSGTASWGSAIVAAARAFREEHGNQPSPDARTRAETPPNSYGQQYAMQAFGAQFAEVRVHADTGEIRVPRLLGVFAAGTIINERTARSQFLGGMTMGLSMALHEQSVLDPRFGHVVNHDFAEYHIATNADVESLQAYWIDEHDPYVNAMGAKGIGEIGIVGTAAALANATYHATGIRVRELPLTADKFLT